ncbi:hypothetical protein A0J61_02822 [Choanephora cucurbitarum]|uniref:Uncharacterized protein n=1 Tax=Choanephora cucurbitarum TaxID=101091 RepID=A0A1C7NJ03_9FUNG|nr:hypothetical protein A0J61_02822 [Choanephora cucurbitarum]
MLQKHHENLPHHVSLSSLLIYTRRPRKDRERRDTLKSNEPQTSLKHSRQEERQENELNVVEYISKAEGQVEYLNENDYSPNHVRALRCFSKIVDGPGRWFRAALYQIAAEGKDFLKIR